MLITDEEGDLKFEFMKWLETTPRRADIDSFRAGWQVGRLWERAYHTASAREMCGVNGEHGDDDHPAGHTH